MIKTKNIWLFIATIMFVVCVLGFTFSVTTPEVNAETGETWTASENWDTTTEGEYKLSASNSLSQLTYNGTMGKVSSVKFDFTYTNVTTAGDHWVGVSVNGWWHQLFLNASHETALPYMAIYAPGANSPTFTRIDNRIEREKIPIGEKNTFELKWGNGSIDFYINGEQKYIFAGYTHSNVTEIIIGTRDVEITLNNLSVTTEQEQPVDPSQTGWVESGNFVKTDDVYTTEAFSSLSAVKYAGDMTKYGSASAVFNYGKTIKAGDHWVGWSVNGYTFQLFLNATHATALPIMQVYKPGKSDPDWVSNRIPREKINFDTDNTLSIAIDEDYVVVKLNGEELLTCGGLVFEKFTSLAFATRDIAVTVKDPAVYDRKTNPDVPVDPDAEWVSNGKFTEENGVYTAHKTGLSASLKYNGDVENLNCVSFEFYYKNDVSAGDHCVGWKVGDYRFKIYINATYGVKPYVALSNGKSETSSTRFDVIEAETWNTAKLILDNGSASFYVCGNLVWETMVNLENLNEVEIYSYAVEAQIRNPMAENIVVKKLDLEFNSLGSVENMLCENGSLSYDSGKLVASVNEGFVLSTPQIDVARGHKYSMYMPLRNTFLVRMNNETSATKLKLSFRTSTSADGYWFTKEFDILSDGGWQTYYFNVSDLNPTGYLRQFKMEFTGATDGNVYIDAITFEREERIYNYAGNIESCIADVNSKTVTVKGVAKEKYNGKTVVIWQSSPKNYTDSLNYSDIKKLTTAKVENGKFEATFPLYKENSAQTQLSSYFLASIDGVKVDTHFTIENYRDFNNDPERFKVDIKLVADVTEYGAKGDGFTDDTEAFQKAIDAVNKAGGGKVIIPGDDSVYGRRYVITHIELCSNLEFVIEKGAVIWQSQREDELNKTVPVHQRGYDKVTYGHNVDIDGLVWCHAALTVNKPLIFAGKCENLRITGEGSIRMNDLGGEVEDPVYFVGDPGLAAGCENRVQQMVLCIYNSKHVDITDITIMRSSSYHCYMSFNDDVYLGNVTEKQAASITSDGFSIVSSKNVTLDRCFNYTSDDALVLCSSYDDGRAQFFRPTFPEADNAIENIVVRHCFIYGGFGVSWIPYGTAATNQYNQEIRNVLITDCSLGGHKATGSWPDDPFYGWSAYGNYTQSEDNNYVPIKDVTYLNNEYLADFDLPIYGIAPKFTNLLVWDDVEGTIYSSSEMLNGDFDKQVHKGNGFKDETDFVTGLSYWSNTGSVGYEKVGTKQAYTVDTKELITQNNYAGYIDGKGSLYQGIYKLFGNYNLNMKVKLVSGSAKLFVRDAFTGTVYAEKLIDATSEEFVAYSLPFGLVKSATIQVGIENLGSDGNRVYIDDAAVTDDEDENRYVIEGEEYNYDFEEDYKEFTIYTTSGAKAEIKDGKLVFESTGEVKYMWNNVKDLTTVDVTMKVAIKSEMNVGLYVFATNVSSEPDNINAYNVQIERDATKSSVTLYRFTNKYDGSLASGTVEFTGTEFTLRVLVKQSTIFAFVNGEEEPLFAYETPKGKAGNIGIRSQYRASEINYLKIVSNEAQLAAGDSSSLNTLIGTAKTYKEYDYTAATYSVLKAALEEAEKAVGLTQYKIDKAYETLYNALMSLERLPAGDKTQLNALIATAKGVDQSKYTADSYAALKNALKVAEDLDENATQGAIDEAYKALDEAYKALEEKPTDPDTDSSTDSGNTSDSGATSDSGNKSNKKGCKGGIENSSVMLFILGMVAVYAIVKRRRVNE